MNRWQLSLEGPWGFKCRCGARRRLHHWYCGSCGTERSLLSWSLEHLLASAIAALIVAALVALAFTVLDRPTPGDWNWGFFFAFVFGALAWVVAFNVYLLVAALKSAIAAGTGARHRAAAAVGLVLAWILQLAGTLFL